MAGGGDEVLTPVLSLAGDIFSDAGEKWVAGSESNLFTVRG